MDATIAQTGSSQQGVLESKAQARVVRGRGAPTGPANVLLVGYNGANNTGAEALLLADIEDLRSVLGTGVHLTVPTLNEANLRRYLRESATLRIVPIPPIFFPALRRLVHEHDLIVLVEGSAYMDTWTSVLLWYFLWATHCAHVMGKPCLAYAVDAGSMSSFNQRLTRSVASKTDVIITRSQGAADRLRSWGVTAPIEITADNALTFRPDPEDEGWPQRAWPEAAAGMVGLAVVDFYLWPVVVRPWGRREDCYRWPYYFTRSEERRRASEVLARGYAALADSIVNRGKAVALIAMEQLDEPLARDVQRRMAHKARVFSSREYNASQMTVLLRSLELLVTSRYHACVLSLAAQVPQLAVGHDLRLETIYRELGLADEFFIRPGPGMFDILQDRIEKLLAEPALQKEMLCRGYSMHLADAKRNRELLRAFVKAHGWEVAA
jgi:polysaccharide pyruvyl transferase WcaK-like protein